MKVVFYLALLSICFVFFSCKRGDCDSEQTFYIDEELKEYMLHPVGSYWVYQDSVSQELDTITINLDESEFWTIGNHSCDVREVIWTHIISSKRKDTVNIRLEKDGYGKMKSYYSTFDNGFVFMPALIQGEVVHSGDFVETHYLGFYANDTLNGVAYKDVNKFKNIVNEGGESESYNILYIAKGIGFIRKEYSNGEVWNLVDYKVG